MGMAGAGIALGIAIALLKGLVLNQTVGRPLQLETQLHIPLMLSIPYRNGHFALPRNGSSENPERLREVGPTASCTMGARPFHSAVL